MRDLVSQVSATRKVSEGCERIGDRAITDGVDVEVEACGVQYGGRLAQLLELEVGKTVLVRVSDIGVMHCRREVFAHAVEHDLGRGRAEETTRTIATVDHRTDLVTRQGRRPPERTRHPGAKRAVGGSAAIEIEGVGNAEELSDERVLPRGDTARVQVGLRLPQCLAQGRVIEGWAHWREQLRGHLHELTGGLATRVARDASTPGIRCARVDSGRLERASVDPHAVRVVAHERGRAIGHQAIELVLGRESPGEDVAVPS